MSNYQYGGNSVALEIAIKQIKLYKDALALCPKVMEVVRKFDGKVANKRLETALEAIDKGLNCRKSTYTDIWEISFYTSDRSLTVKSESWDGKYFSEGYNYVNGEEALSFVRERHSLSGGDFARGRNQMRMIQAVVDKVTSPAILTSYMSLMDSLSYAFVTSMPKDTISELVRNQLDDNTDWHITNYEVQGEGNWRVCYSSGDERSVVDLYDDSIEEAISKMQDVLDGKRLAD